MTSPSIQNLSFPLTIIAFSADDQTFLTLVFSLVSKPDISYCAKKIGLVHLVIPAVSLVMITPKFTPTQLSHVFSVNIWNSMWLGTFKCMLLLRLLVYHLYYHQYCYWYTSSRLCQSKADIRN